MKRLILPILAALLIWIVIFFLCAVYLSDGLALRFETPPEGGTLRIRFDPEGIAAVSGTALLPDGLETEVRFAALSQGVTEAKASWEDIPADSLYAGEMPMTLRSLPFGILHDSITWNFTGWEYLLYCLPGCFLTIAGIFYFASVRERMIVEAVSTWLL